MTPKTKPPTASGISRLLAAAGFERSERRQVGADLASTEGFSALKWNDFGTVAVSYNRGLKLPTEAEQIRPEMFRRYTEVITAAGYSVIERRGRLLVTASPSSLLAAKDGDN
jgi:hypothetical protein